MTVFKSQHFALGAVFLMSLGLPIVAQSGTNYDSLPYGSGTERTQNRDWATPHSDYNRSGNRNYDDRQYYTNQYGDLDTIDERKTPNRYDNGRSIQTNTSSSKRDPYFRDENRRSDDGLRQDIINELGEGTERVRVAVKGGVATLTGMVLNREAMLEAIEAAYEGGARKVRNELEVFRYEDRPWADKSDRSLARAVREELNWSPFVDSDPIRVMAKNGVVTLKGSVEDRSEMAAAVENAYDAGARRVKNQLHIAN